MYNMASCIRPMCPTLATISAKSSPASGKVKPSSSWTDTNPSPASAPSKAPHSPTPRGTGDLVRRGLIRLATQRLKPEPFSDLPWPTPHAGGDILATLLADREEGR